MPNDQKPYLIAENLRYEVNPTRSLFTGLHVSLCAGDHIALVGSNGVGKSTLLKLLAGQKTPAQGTVTGKSAPYYLPQISTIRAFLQSHSVFDFLAEISSEWWEIEHVLESAFSTVLDLSLPMQSLSGGELTKLFLAIGLWRTPDILLLDEPTNHLDYFALDQLRHVLCQFRGAFIIVSHKPFFLDQVASETWELMPSGVQVYGGNFSFYREQKALDKAAKVRSHEIARKALRKTKATVQSEQKRAAQSKRSGRQKFLRGDIPRIVAGGKQRAAESTAGKLKIKHDESVVIATKNVSDTKIRTNKATSIQLESRKQKYRNLIEINGANLWVNERLLIEDIQFRLFSGERVAMAGPNGSGKSSLVKAMLGSVSTSMLLKGGTVQLAEMHTVYLDQGYALVDRTQTVLENMHRANPALDYQRLRQQLGHFLFFNDDVYKPASVLSGGELARCAISMITISELDLLILDEPTNNLDIETVDQMVEALSGYEGALWVISHDLDFLSRIDINCSFHLVHGTLKQTDHLPSDQSLYYNELLKLQ